MAQYQITGPDGARYRVTGPDGASDDEVLAQVQNHVTIGPPQEAQHPDAMGTLTTPQSEVGYLLNSVNGVPGLNLLKEAGAGIRGGVAAATGGSFGDEYNKSRENQDKLMYNQEQQQPDFHGVKPDMLGRGGAALTSAGFLPVAGATGNIVGDATVGSLEGMGYGAASGFGNGTDFNSRLANALAGGETGLGLGAVGGLAAGGVNSLRGAYRDLYPAARIDAAQDALREGIPIYKNNLSDSKTLNYLSTASNEIPSAFGGTSNRVPGQQQAMAEALTKSVGNKSNELSDAVLQEGKDASGKAIGAINAKYTVPFQVQMNADLRMLQQQAKQQLTGDSLDLFNKRIASLKADAKAQGGTLPGQQYQATRTALNEEIQNTRTGSTAKYSSMLRDLRDTIDNHFAAQASPADQAILDQSRRQYRNAMTLEPITDKYPLGDYPMGGLQNKVVDNPELAPLGRVGQLMKNITGNSGTAQRELLQKIGGGVAALGGATTAAHEVDPDWWHDAAYLAGASIGPGLANRALNPRVTNYSINGMQAMQPVNAQMGALAAALRRVPATTPLALSFSQQQDGEK